MDGRKYADYFWLTGVVFKAAPGETVLWSAFGLAGGCLTGLQLWLTKGAVDTLTGGNGFRDVVPWITGLAASFMLSQTIGPFGGYLQEKVKAVAGFHIQESALDKTARMPLESLDAQGTYDIVRRVADGADHRGPDAVGRILGFAGSLPGIAANAVAVSLVSPWFLIPIGMGSVLLMWRSAKSGGRARRTEVETTHFQRLADYLASLLTSREFGSELRIWGLRRHLFERWHGAYGEYARRRLRTQNRNAVEMAMGTSALFSVVVGGIILAISSRGKPVEAGVAALLFSSLTGLLYGLWGWSRRMPGFVQDAGYAEDLRTLLQDMPVEGSIDAAGAEMPDPWHCIRFEGVSFRYPGGEADALCNVNLEIRRGERVALVGANGAGKSTLASLIMGLRRPTSGRILIDGTDVGSISPDAYRRIFAAVQQTPLRYPATLHENLVFDGLEFEREDALAFLRDIGGGEWAELAAENPPLGPEYGGRGLSGGQWQLLSVARTLTREKASVAIFDEPTSAMDPMAELELFNRFAKASMGKTTLLISHRLGPTRLADRVVVLDGGRVVEEGPPGKLIALGGTYAKMYEGQAEWYR